MLDGAPVKTLKGGPEFAAAYAKAFDTPLEAYAPFAYSAANTIIKAIEKVGPLRRMALDKQRRRIEQRSPPEDHPAPFRAIEAVEAAFCWTGSVSTTPRAWPRC